MRPGSTGEARKEELSQIRLQFPTNSAVGADPFTCRFRARSEFLRAGSNPCHRMRQVFGKGIRHVPSITLAEKWERQTAPSPRWFRSGPPWSRWT